MLRWLSYLVGEGINTNYEQIAPVSGGAWYRNTGKPREQPFEQIVFDKKWQPPKDNANWGKNHARLH